MTPPRILIAGIGNIFLGDDAFGVEVVQRLARRPQTPGVRVADFGIRGLDLTYALLDGYDAVILVDATCRGEAPGTLYVIEPEAAAAPSLADAAAGNIMIDGHNMDPAKVLSLVAAMGSHIERLMVVGCEPTPLNSPDEMEMGFSPPVMAALDGAVELVESLVLKIRQDPRPIVASPDRASPDMKGDCDHASPHPIL